MTHASASKRSPARTVALATVVTLLIGLPVVAAVRTAPAAAGGDLQAPSAQGPRQTQPNFQPPIATSCSDTPALSEVPDPSPKQDYNAPRTRHPMMEDREAIVAVDAMASSPPVPALAPAPLASRVADVKMTGASASASRADAVQIAAQVPVTAGVVDDNADFGEFQQFLQRHEESAGLGRDVSVRQRLRVVDTQGRPVPDAEVSVAAADGARMWARTDAGGQVWVHPNAFDDRASGRYQVQVRRDGKRVDAILERGQKNTLQVVMPDAALPARARLDLVFLVDATGSMGDEIDKLRGSLQGIVRDISRLPSNPDICLGLVTYRDRGDEYFVRGWNLTRNVGAFQKVLDGVQANGGGDTPEAMNEAFGHAVQSLSWRGPSTTRVLVSLADAPPHMDYPQPHYDQTMLAALGKGIKVFSVAASGQDTTGEIVQRQIAQYTGGRFIFLTYKDAADPSSGPGTQTSHDVSNYSVDTLDKLVVRLVREELAQLPKG